MLMFHLLSKIKPKNPFNVKNAQNDNDLVLRNKRFTTARSIQEKYEENRKQRHPETIAKNKCPK